jgi:single-strand DNA-binding protein
MAMSLNRVQLIGNVTRDPEVRQIPGGKTVATFSIATNFTWTDATGQKKDKAEFHNLVAWGKLGEICGQYLKKGSKAFVEGRMQTRDWEGEDGVKRSKVEIVIDNMIMLDRKEGSGSFGGSSGPSFASSASEGPREHRSMTPKATERVSEEEESPIDDLPF